MPATFNIPTQNVIPGQLIASTLWNAEYKNIYDNFTPGGMDDYSATSGQMQTMTDPFPGSILSLPTSLAGELERQRYVINGLKGSTNWYEVPTRTMAALNTLLLGHTHTGSADGTQIPTGGIANSAVTTAKIANANVTSAKMASGVVFESGVVSMFYMAAAPTGWTKLTDQNDKALRVVSGSGGVAGGTTGLAGGITHTVAAHTHSIGTHSHTLNATDSHSAVNYSAAGEIGAPDDTQALRYVNAGGGETIYHRAARTDVGDSAGTTGSASPSTDTITLAYVDVIMCMRN